VKAYALMRSPGVSLGIGTWSAGVCGSFVVWGSRDFVGDGCLRVCVRLVLEHLNIHRGFLGVPGIVMMHRTAHCVCWIGVWVVCVLHGVRSMVVSLPLRRAPLATERPGGGFAAGLWFAADADCGMQKG
jgi:hypothetical protein